MTINSTLVQDTQVGFFNVDKGNECLGAESETPNCRAALKKVQSVTGTVAIVSACLSFFLTPLMGNFSDAFGRRSILIATEMAACIQYALLAAYAFFDLNLWFYICMSATHGAFMPLSYAFAYASDITQPHERAFTFALLMASLQVSFVLGPILATYTVLPDSTIFAMSTASIFSCLIYTIICTPESLSHELQVKARREIVAQSQQQQQQEQSLNQNQLQQPSINEGRNDAAQPVLSSADVNRVDDGMLLLPDSPPCDSHDVPPTSTVLSALFLRNPFRPLLILNRTRFLRTLAGVAILLFFCLMGMMSITYMYLHARFGMNRQQHAIMSVVNGCCGLLVQSVGAKYISRYASNYTMMQLGLSFMALSAVMYACLWEMIPWLYFILPIASLGTLTFPALTALKSNAVNHAEQGAIQGALAGVRSLGTGLGPLIFNQIMSHTQDTDYKQLPFITSAAVTVAAILLACTIPKEHRDERASGEELPVEVEGKDVEDVLRKMKLSDDAAGMDGDGDGELIHAEAVNIPCVPDSGMTAVVSLSVSASFSRPRPSPLHSRKHSLVSGYHTLHGGEEGPHHHLS